MQHIKLLTPHSDFEYLLVERAPDWFSDENDTGSFLRGEEARLCRHEATGQWESLGELRLSLFVKVYNDDEPISWYFALNHEYFENVPLYEWECAVPDESTPTILIDCNQIREFKAKHSGR